MTVELPDYLQFDSRYTIATVNQHTVQLRLGDISVVTVSGPHAEYLVPALLIDLDGSEPWESAVPRCERLASAEVIRECVSELFAKGVLVERSGERIGSIGADSKVGIQPARIATLPSSSPVDELIIVGYPPSRLPFAQAFGQLGFRSIQFVAPDSVCTLTSRSFLVSVIPALEAGRYDRLNEHALQAGSAWLPVDLDSGPIISIGPLVIPEEGPCYQCYRDRLRSNMPSHICQDYDAFVRYQRHTACVVSAVNSYPNAVFLAANLAAVEVWRWISRAEVPATIGHVLLFTLPQFSLEKHRVLRLPRCSACGVSHAAKGHWGL